MVMEYLGGGTLHWLVTHSSPLLRAHIQLQRALALDVARGMAYLHTRKILHRDLNSKNVLLDEHYTAKISDFGLARAQRDAGAQLTQHVGFLASMAPEVFRGEHYAEPADVYSYAMLLYELFALVPVTAKQGHEDLLAFAYKAAREDARPSLPPDLDASWRSLIEESWHREPTQRPTFAQILERLEATTTTTTTTSSSSDMPRDSMSFRDDDAPSPYDYVT
jgi:serine/threonine protein kinase